MGQFKTIWIICLTTMALTGCSRSIPSQTEVGPSSARGVPNSANRLRFIDTTTESQIRFTYCSGAEHSYAPILEEVGGGCGLMDMDRDGWLDAFFPGGGNISPSGLQPVPNGCFQNQGDGSFRDVSQSSGLMYSRFYSHGVASADYDSDGFPDLLVTGYGGLQLYHNQGDGTFAERAEIANLTDDLWSTSAAWGDVNRDGHLDLFVCHYVDWSRDNDPVCHGPEPGLLDSCPPEYFKGLPDSLYLSKGEGTFEEISKTAGLRSDGKGLGVVMADLDADGDIDIYVANDGVANFVYRNEGRDFAGIPRFADVGTESGAALSESGSADGSMGVAILNLNQDSRPDLWVSNFEFETPGLYRNEADFRFSHIARSAGVASPSGSFVSFGTVSADFDGDGDDDVLVTNGHISRYPRNGTVQQPCQLFENLGDARFRDVAGAAGECLGTPCMGRGLAAGDLDGDGDVDVILSPRDQAVRVFKNTQTAVPRWLQIQLVGTTGPRDGHGATITLLRNQSRRMHWIYGGESYLSSSSSWIRFPDDMPGIPLELQVAWPSGKTQRLIRGESNEWRVDDNSLFRGAAGVLIILEPNSGTELADRSPSI